MNTTVIERLFARLGATYGAAWERAMGSVPTADVKTVWANELDGFSGKLHAIAWALENLPERCPNVIEFRNLCRRAPAPDVPALPLSRPDPQRLRTELEKLAPVLHASRQACAAADPKAWAKRLRDRHASGAQLRPVQIDAYRAALGLREPQ